MYMYMQGSICQGMSKGGAEILVISFLSFNICNVRDTEMSEKMSFYHTNVSIVP